MKRLLLLLFVIAGASIAYGQDQPKPISAEAIKKMADDKKFIFKAQNSTLNDRDSRNGGFVPTIPSKLNHLRLSGNYSAVVAPDAVSSYLPYYGKAEMDGQANDNVNLTMDENATKFSTTAFDYTVKQKKKGDVVITIKPKDSKDVEKYVFEFALDGTAKLELSVSGRTINYDGIFMAQ